MPCTPPEHRCWIYEWSHPTWSEIVVALKFLARAADASRCVLRGNAEAEDISGRLLSSVPRTIDASVVSALFHRLALVRVLSLYAPLKCFNPRNLFSMLTLAYYRVGISYPGACVVRARLEGCFEIRRQVVAQAALIATCPSTQSASANGHAG